MKVELPHKLYPLILPKRYKVIHGGRGGAKSWSVARILLLLAKDQPLRILCAREIQKSIKDSVHQLLCDQIKELKLSAHFEILQTEIRGKNGSRFSFAGLRSNVSEIKSYEGVDKVWVEEAQAVSKTSWDILIPTIRKDNSEIWITFNPVHKDDNTYQRFVVNPPNDSVVIRCNWNDNPWFPEVLRKEMEELKAKDPDAWLNVWEGNCREILDGAIYANEIRKAKEESRICRVVYDQQKPVSTFWDLGWSDCTSIWFAQWVGQDLRVIDFYQNHLQPLQHYIQMLQSRGYIYGTDFLPHDARAKNLGTGRSVEELLRSAGRKVQIVPMLSVHDGIQAAKTIFPLMWFDESKCSEGISALSRYRYDVDPDTKAFSKNPLHDDASHAADAFRYLSVAFKETKPVRKQPRAPNGGWMSL